LIVTVNLFGPEADGNPNILDYSQSQWRRSVLKSGVRVSQSLQAIKLFHITRFLTLNKFRTWQA